MVCGNTSAAASIIPRHLSTTMSRTPSRPLLQYIFRFGTSQPLLPSVRLDRSHASCFPHSGDLFLAIARGFGEWESLTSQRPLAWLVSHRNIGPQPSASLRLKSVSRTPLSSTFRPHPLLSILVRNLRFRALCHPADFLGDKSDVSLRHIGNFIELFTRHLEERFIHSV